MNGNEIVLDTNQAIDVLNNRADTGTWIAGFERVYFPVPVVGELRFGALNSKRAEENLRHVERLVARCTTLDVTAATAEVYARIRLELKQSGAPIPENDLWIAATCIQHNLPLASSDEHFRLVPGLQLVPR